MHTSELLCGYPKTSISSRVSQQIVGFSGEIVAYQELHALRGNASTELRLCNHNDDGNEKISENVQHTFYKFRCRHCTTEAVKLN